MKTSKIIIFFTLIGAFLLLNTACEKDEVEPNDKTSYSMEDVEGEWRTNASNYLYYILNADGSAEQGQYSATMDTLTVMASDDNTTWEIDEITWEEYDMESSEAKEQSGQGVIVTDSEGSKNELEIVMTEDSTFSLVDHLMDRTYTLVAGSDDGGDYDEITNITLTDGRTGMSISWDAVDDAKSYMVSVNGEADSDLPITGIPYKPDTEIQEGDEIKVEAFSDPDTTDLIAVGTITYGGGDTPEPDDEVSLSNLSGNYYTTDQYSTWDYLSLKEDGTLKAVKDQESTEYTVELVDGQLQLQDDEKIEMEYSTQSAIDILYDHESNIAILYIDDYRTSAPYKKNNTEDWGLVDLIQNVSIEAIIPVDAENDLYDIKLSVDALETGMLTLGALQAIAGSSADGTLGNTNIYITSEENYGPAGGYDSDRDLVIDADAGTITIPFNFTEMPTPSGIQEFPEYAKYAFKIQGRDYDSNFSGDGGSPYPDINGDESRILSIEGDVETELRSILNVEVDYANNTMSVTPTWDFVAGDGTSDLSDYTFKRRNISDGETEYTEVTLTATGGKTGSAYTDDNVEETKVYQYQISGILNDDDNFTLETNAVAALPRPSVETTVGNDVNTYSWDEIPWDDVKVKVSVQNSDVDYYETKEFTGTSATVGEDGTGSDFEVGSVSGGGVASGYKVIVRYFVNVDGEKYNGPGKAGEDYYLED